MPKKHEKKSEPKNKPVTETEFKKYSGYELLEVEPQVASDN